MLGNAVFTEENGAQRVMASDVETALPFESNVPCPANPANCFPGIELWFKTVEATLDTPYGRNIQGTFLVDLPWFHVQEVDLLSILEFAKSTTSIIAFWIPCENFGPRLRIEVEMLRIERRTLKE